MLSKYTHVIFDFDATLATFQVDWSGWVRGIMEIMGKYDPNFDFSKKPSHSMLNDFIKKYQDPIYQEILDFSNNFEVENIKGAVPNPKALALLGSIVLPQKAYLYTTNSIKVVRPALHELGIENSFAKIISREDVRYIKPDPDGFNQIYDPNIPLSEYIMVGDSSSDEGVAKNAGIDFLSVHTL